MTGIRTKYWWLILCAYPMIGLVLGLADPTLGRVAQQLGTKPGVATAVSVNLLLPLVAVALGLAAARLRSAWLGAVTLTLGFLVGLAICYPAGVQDWSPVGVLRSIPPVLVAAALGYAALGTLAVLGRRAWRTRGWYEGPPAG
jgi:hypothetical protein